MVTSVLRGPTALIGGAQKSATTALFRLLEEHPDVATPANKEPQYFAYAGTTPKWNGPRAEDFANTVVTDEDTYRRMFSHGQQAQQRIEASTLYLSEAHVPERVLDFDPAMRVIFIFRDPVDRIASAFEYLRLQGIEPLCSVREALAAEDKRIADGWPAHFGYMRLSAYGDHLQRWNQTFPSDQILCLEQSQFADEPETTMSDVEKFLGLDPFDRYSFGVRHNTSGKPRSRRLQQLLEVRFPYRSELRRLAPRRARNAVAWAKHRNLERQRILTDEDAAYLADRLAPQVDLVEQSLGQSFVARWRRG